MGRAIHKTTMTYLLTPGVRRYARKQRRKKTGALYEKSKPNTQEVKTEKFIDWGWVFRATLFIALVVFIIWLNVKK